MNGLNAEAGEACPFAFNFDPGSFEVGQTVSFRVPSLGDFPFAGELLEVHDGYVVI